MSSPTITYLLLDSSYDPVFDPVVALTDRDAIAQAILTRLKLFYGEWFGDLRLGLPVFQKMLGQLESQKNLQMMQLLVQQQILTLSPYITSITNLSAQFVDAQFNFSCTVQTIFGQVTVTNAPGVDAALAT